MTCALTIFARERSVCFLRSASILCDGPCSSRINLRTAGKEKRNEIDSRLSFVHTDWVYRDSAGGGKVASMIIQIRRETTVRSVGRWKEWVVAGKEVLSWKAGKLEEREIVWRQREGSGPAVAWIGKLTVCM